jgi:membrane protein DedA with SNARE-associated domain
MTPQLPSFVAAAVDAVGHYRYLLLFIGTIVEGPMLMAACGFLLHMGVFQPLPMFIALGSGDLVADVGWYYAGQYLLEPMMRKHGHFLSVTPKAVEKAKMLFRYHHTRILIISKITMGFGMALAVLMVAGASRVPFKKYFIINTAGEIIFVAVMLSIGYWLGSAYTILAGGMKWLFLIGATVLIVALVTGISRFARQILHVA